PPCVDVHGRGAGRGARETRTVQDEGGHQPRGKFMASTKICSKSGCAANETCSIRAAIVSACARSACERGQRRAPSEAALPTHRRRGGGRDGISPIRMALGIER